MNVQSPFLPWRCEVKMSRYQHVLSWPTTQMMGCYAGRGISCAVPHQFFRVYARRIRRTLATYHPAFLWDWDVIGRPVSRNHGWDCRDTPA